MEALLQKFFRKTPAQTVTGGGVNVPQFNRQRPTSTDWRAHKIATTRPAAPTDELEANHYRSADT